LALLFASLVVTLLMLEGLVRIFLPEQRPLFEKDPRVGHHYRPGFSGLRFIPEAGRPVYLRFNQLGYRGPDYEREKPDGVYRVAVLGDSFVAAVAVDENETVPAHLERQFNADGSGQVWQAMNFGIGAYSTAQSLLTWRAFAREFHADLVVLCFFIGNDIVDNSAELTGYPRPYFSLDAAGALVPPRSTTTRDLFTQWLNDYSALYVWQKLRSRELRRRLRTAAAEPPPAADVFNTHVRPDYERSWRLTEKLIEACADEVKASGAAFLLATIPSRYQCIESDWQQMLATADPSAALDRTYPDTRLAAFAARQGIPFVAVLDTCRAYPRPGDLYFPFEHWTARGNRLGAETIHRAIRAMRLVPPLGANEKHPSASSSLTTPSCSGMKTGSTAQ